MNSTDTSSHEDPAPVSQDTHATQHNTGMAIVAYILFFIPLLTDAKNDPFVKYHVRQGLVLFLTGLCVSILSWIPPIMFISPLLYLGVLALAIFGIVHAAQGKETPLPLIGQFASHFKI